MTELSQQGRARSWRRKYSARSWMCDTRPGASSGWRCALPLIFNELKSKWEGIIQDSLFSFGVRMISCSTRRYCTRTNSFHESEILYSSFRLHCVPLSVISLGGIAIASPYTLSYNSNTSSLVCSLSLFVPFRCRFWGEQMTESVSGARLEAAVVSECTNNSVLAATMATRIEYSKHSGRSSAQKPIDSDAKVISKMRNRGERMWQKLICYFNFQFSRGPKLCEPTIRVLNQALNEKIECFSISMKNAHRNARAKCCLAPSPSFDVIDSMDDFRRNIVSE